MSDTIIRKYAKGTPKPYAVPMTKKIASEQEAGKFVSACGDRKAVADKVEGGYVVHYRRWFEDIKTAQSFVDSMREKQELRTKLAALKPELEKIAELMATRGKKELEEKTKALLGKI